MLRLAVFAGLVGYGFLRSWIGNARGHCALSSEHCQFRWGGGALSTEKAHAKAKRYAKQ